MEIEEEENREKYDEEEEITIIEEESKEKLKSKKKINKIDWERCYKIKMGESYEEETLTYFNHYISGIMKKIKYEEEINKKQKPNLEVLNEYKEELLRYNKKKKRTFKNKTFRKKKKKKITPPKRPSKK